MHLCLQGHMKWLLTQLIENEESDYILGLLKTNNTTNSIYNFFQQNILFESKTSIEKINTLLINTKMPHNINRKPTSIEQFNKWKSSELKVFLFYESIPMLTVL